MKYLYRSDLHNNCLVIAIATVKLMGMQKVSYLVFIVQDDIYYSLGSNSVILKQANP